MKFLSWTFSQALVNYNSVLITAVHLVTDWSRQYEVVLIQHCVQKKTPTHVSLYISMENVHISINLSGSVVGGNKYSTGWKVRYPFLLVTSCWRHIFTLVNYAFYRWRQTFDKMFASQQGLWSYKFVQDVSEQWTENWILMEWNIWIKKN